MERGLRVRYVVVVVTTIAHRHHHHAPPRTKLPTQHASSLARSYANHQQLSHAHACTCDVQPMCGPSHVCAVACHTSVCRRAAGPHVFQVQLQHTRKGQLQVPALPAEEQEHHAQVRCTAATRGATCACPATPLLLHQCQSSFPPFDLLACAQAVRHVQRRIAHPDQLQERRSAVRAAAARSLSAPTALAPTVARSRPRPVH